MIDENTACVILETIQGGAGFITPENNFLIKVKKDVKRLEPNDFRRTTNWP